jgi:hypothetical protein
MNTLSVLARGASLGLGVIAVSGLLVGCVGEDEPSDELPDETEKLADPEALAAGDVAHIASTGGKSQSGSPQIRVPNGTQAGDLLVLFLHRTDATNFWASNGRGDRLADRLRPWRAGGWSGPVATCAFDNSANDFDCAGQQSDLNQTMYWKRATSDDLRRDPNDSSKYEALTIDFPGDKPAWAIMATLRNGGASSNPVRAWKGQTRCDQSSGTEFPSVNGNAGDLLLLSQSFDDGLDSPGNLTSSHFTAGSGITRYLQVLDKDEAGHLYGRRLTTTGATPVYKANGGSPAPSSCKDIAVSIVIRKTGT